MSGIAKRKRIPEKPRNLTPTLEALRQDVCLIQSQLNSLYQLCEYMLVRIDEDIR